MKRKFLVFIVSVGLFTAAVGGIFYLLTKQFLFEGPEKVGREVIYEVKLGQSFNSISRDLQAKGVLKSAEAFSVYGRFTRQIPNVKVGEYKLSTAMTPPQVMAVITSGYSVTRAITIPEGYSIFEIAELLELKGFASRAEIMKLAFNKEFAKKLLGVERPSLEGYLYPDTYGFTKYMGAEKILGEMVKTFKENFARVPKPYPFEWNDYQVITMASIIEKETGKPSDQGLISAVFNNRLLIGMRLQTDPTVIYGLGESFDGNLRRADLLADTPYNTYTREGLPPSPISIPGKTALLAAVQPAASKALYFVARGDGSSEFSESLDAHNRAVNKYQRGQ